MRAVVISGGKGARLYPITREIPKAMVQIGDKPILEIIIDQLAHYGFRDITLVTNHKHEQIERHFEDGRQFGVRIGYLRERVPLGTVGAIGLIKDIQGDFLLMNCDILTDLDFRAMMDTHKSSGNAATVLAVKHEERYPYGVLGVEDDVVHNVDEKPLLSFHIYGGVSIFRPEVALRVDVTTKMDVPELLGKLLRNGRVGTVPFKGIWVDIGDMKNYAKALDLYRNNKHRIRKQLRVSNEG